MTDPKTELKCELGSHIALIDSLEGNEAADLLALFHNAQVSDALALTEAVDATINGLPRLFRGTARKIIFPGGK